MKTLFVDMDDTLFDTQGLYDNNSFICATQIISYFHLNITVEELIQEMNELQAKLIEENGFSPYLYAAAWADLYVKYAKEKNMPVSNSKKRKIYLLAENVFRQSLSVYEGVYETLLTLKKEGYQLILLTLGEQKIQQKRINDANLSTYFDELIITPEKSPKMMEKILNDRQLNPRDCVMIGNSLKSDVHPALSSGMKALHISCDTWGYDDFTVDTNHKNYTSIHSFNDSILSLTEELSKKESA